MTSLPPLLRRLGQVIRTLRRQTGLSQERFGFAIGVHRTYMGHLERGTANPTVKMLHLVARGLGVSLSDLFTAAIIENSGESRPAGTARAGQASDRPELPPDRLGGGRARAQVVRASGRKRRTGKRGDEEWDG
jgi:transcriptional regulator with XRE-family HTH domain